MNQIATTIGVTVESEPQAVPPGELLIRPVPTGGAFLIDTRVPRDVFDAMKEQGVYYLSSDDLEEYDMFRSSPGWRYSLAALGVLLQHGYQLEVRGEIVTTMERLDELFSQEGTAAYRARVAHDRVVAEQAAADEKARQEAEAARKEEEYARWKEQHLASLVYTSTWRSDKGIAWRRERHFDSSTPGTWYTTGDTYLAAEVGGATIYKCSYGNATVYYVTPALADQWALDHYNHYVGDMYGGDECKAASWVLHQAEIGVFGSDVPRRLIELKGGEYFAAQLRAQGRERFIVPQEAWLSERQVEIVVAERYGLPVTVLTILTEDYGLLGRLKRTDADPYLTKILEAPDGRLFGRDYNNQLHQLSDDDVALVRSVLAQH